MKNSDSYDDFDNTIQMNSTASTKTASPGSQGSSKQITVINENEVSVIDGQFGYSKFGDCELGYLTVRGDKKLIMLKALSFSKFRDEFFEEMNEKWRLSSKCLNTFAQFYGYIVKHDYIAMIIEYGDMDLKQFLMTCSPSVVGYVVW